jgi:UDP-N-acetylmuramyl pentapeptide phosphotransferase/UDP-N-acetylglucosamine-1-phosphate transferase
MDAFALGAIVVTSAAVSAGMILALLPVLRRHALAHPNARSSHRVPTPQGGGIAVIGAAVAVIVAVAALGLMGPPDRQGSLWWALGAAVLIALVGVADDINPIGVAPRLALQTVAVGLTIASLPVEFHIVPMLPWWIERSLLLIVCLWFVNLTNFMDGIDWMTVAEFVPLAIGLAIIGLSGALPNHGVAVSLALAGALIGFAPFNRPVARIFLGDVGSLPIGLLFGWLLVLLAGRGHVVAALVLPLYYVADATLTLLQRIARHEPIWKAHRTHFYQRATDRGWSVRGIVTSVFLVNVTLVALAAATVFRPSATMNVAALACAMALVGCQLWSFVRSKP